MQILSPDDIRINFKVVIMKKNKKLKKKSKPKKFKAAKLYKLISRIERKKEFLFVIYDGDNKSVGVDVLCYEGEDNLDGGWFNSLKETYDFIKSYYG